MATCNQMLPSVGQTVTAKFEDLSVSCTVLDVKSSYGRVRMLVSPVSGSGSQWVDAGRLVSPLTVSS